MKHTFTGLMLVAASTCSFAEYVESTLTCRVETELRNGSKLITKKAESITLDIVQNNNEFIIGGYGEMAKVLGSNSPRMEGISNINDRTTSSKFDVEFLLENKDSSASAKVVDEYRLRLDRVSGALDAFNTWKSMGPMASRRTLGNCEKAHKKF